MLTYGRANEARRVRTRYLNTLTFFSFSLHRILLHNLLPTPNLLFNLLIWSLLTRVTLSFQYPVIHHVSITNTSVQGKNGGGMDELNRRCWEKGGVHWQVDVVHSCSLTWSIYIKKSWETLSLWGPNWKKERKIHLSTSWIIKILAYSL